MSYWFTHKDLFIAVHTGKTGWGSGHVKRRDYWDTRLGQERKFVTQQWRDYDNDNFKSEAHQNSKLGRNIFSFARDWHSRFPAEMSKVKVQVTRARWSFESMPVRSPRLVDKSEVINTLQQRCHLAMTISFVDEPQREKLVSAGWYHSGTRPWAYISWQPTPPQNFSSVAKSWKS